MALSLICPTHPTPQIRERSGRRTTEVATLVGNDHDKEFARPTENRWPTWICFIHSIRRRLDPRPARGVRVIALEFRNQRSEKGMRILAEEITLSRNVGRHKIPKEQIQ